MLSTQAIGRLGQLLKEQDRYQPSPEIAAQLAAKTIIMAVGATCMGKNTIMETAARLDQRFHIVGTRTSREPRDGDDPKRYTYYPNTDEGLEPFLDAISKHRAVQYAINPHAWLIYGSMPEDYPAGYNLADVLSGAVQDFQRIGFGRATAITIVGKPAAWLPRVEARFPIGHPQRQARRDEAIESLTWSLAQSPQGPDHFWVENVDGQPEIAAREIIAIALGRSAGQPDARHLAEACVKAARGITI